jgi:hypothetical protein
VTLKVIGSGEIVHQVFWLDLRSRTCGVRLWNPQTDETRCSERPVSDMLIAAPDGKRSRASVENVLGDLAQVILRDES